MIDFEEKDTVSEQPRERYTSTSYSNKITCGRCGAQVRHVPVMYERMDIEWRCAKCLRKDKPVLEDQT